MFEGLAPDFPSNVRNAVRCLSINLGHPSREDFIRTICMQGEVRPAAPAVVQVLRCHMCRRHDRPHPHRSQETCCGIAGSVRKACAWRCFYLHIIAGNPHFVVRLICDATLFHMVPRASDRTPESALPLCRCMRFEAFGLPTTMILDQGMSFGGIFEELAVEMDTYPCVLGTGQWGDSSHKVA